MRHRKYLLGCAAALALLGPASAASAHPYLVASTPQAGVVATSTPKSIQIAFTEQLVLQGCSITIHNAKGQVVPIGRVHSVLGGDGMTVPAANLNEGVYTVNWVALGNDGHTVAGSFQFGVPSPNGAAPPGAEKLLATTSANGTESAPTESFVSVAARWVAAVGLFLLLGGAVLLLRLRGRLEDGLQDAARERWLRVASVGLLAAVAGTVVEALERTRGPQGGILHLDLLTASTSGVAVIIRLAVVVLAALVLRFVARRRRPLLFAAAGALGLASLAVDGHVATARTDKVLVAIVQMGHLLSAGVWVGGVIVLAACVAPVALTAKRPAAVLAAGRAFTPVAIPTALIAIVTGLIAAKREVARWYFLRWSSYGHLVLVKGGLVLIVLGLGGVTTLVARRALASAGEPDDDDGRRRGGITARRLMTGEAVLGVGVLFVAATLAGTLQGRGQPLPSQRGNLLPGAGFANIALKGATAQLTLAPARPGLNRVIVDFAGPYGSQGLTPPPLPDKVDVALSCACGSRPTGLKVPLKPGPAGRSAWYGDVELPLAGAWSAELQVNGKPAVGSPTFTVGVPHVTGSSDVTIASVADLSGPDAIDCRAEEIGSLQSIELMNIVGGINGHKITQELLDDGGNPGVARADATALAAQHPVAFLNPCGQGASAAISAVGNTIPTLVADPNVPVVQGKRVFRFAPNPYAEGYAAGQYIGEIGLPSVPKNTPHVVAAFTTGEPQSEQRLAGLRAGLAHYGVTVDSYPATMRGLEPTLKRLMPSDKTLGIYLDGPFDPLAAALHEIGPQIQGTVNPTAIMVSSRLSGERFVEASGQLGREGQIRAIDDVDPTSNGAQEYASLAPQIVGELPSTPGLNGFVAGQALAYGLRAGNSASAISARLVRVGVFSQAATSPWSDQNPASGTLIFRVFLPSFLTENLIPAGGGNPGEVTEGQFFPDGDWEPGSPSVFSPLPLSPAVTGQNGSGSYLHPTGSPQGQGTAVVPQLGSGGAVLAPEHRGAGG